MERLRTLSFAASSGRVGMVLIVGDRLMDWRISRKGGASPEAATAYAAMLIADLKPDVVVTEALGSASSKGPNTRAIIAAIAEVAREHTLLDISVPRMQLYASKYDEAEALAERWPDIAAWKPRRRRFYDSEPRGTVLFEALALAEGVLLHRHE